MFLKQLRVKPNTISIGGCGGLVGMSSKNKEDEWVLWGEVEALHQLTSFKMGLQERLEAFVKLISHAAVWG